MNQLKSMAMFVKIIEHGSLRGAARELGVSPGTVSARLDSLEQYLGVQLLQRSTRALVLTDEGTAYLEYARRLLIEVTEFEQHLRGDALAPQGRLTISAPSTVANHLLLPILGGFLERYPGVSIELTLSQHAYETTATAGRSVNDVMLRLGPLVDSSLVARPLGYEQVVTVASPAYLERYGVPANPEALAGHCCIGITVPDTGRISQWRFQRDGCLITVNASGPLVIKGAEGRIHAAIAGLGITQAPLFAVMGELKAGRLMRLLCGFDVGVPPLYVVYEKTRQHSRRVAAFVDYLLECFPADQPVVVPTSAASTASLTTDAP